MRGDEMAADPGSNRFSLLLILSLAVTGYVAWEVAPLSRRMDEIDRDRLGTNDRLQREIEKLRDELSRARFASSVPSAGAAPASPPIAAPTARSSSAVPA